MIAAALVAALSLALPGSAVACATCGCSLSADAAMGYSASAGWRVSLEYDYLDQDELRSGTRRVGGVPDGNELERYTRNQYLTTGVSYSPGPAWSISFYAPYVIRSHSTYGTFDSTQPLPPPSSSSSSSLGDLRILGAWQGLLPENNLGIQLGVKLPTGRYGTAVTFDHGPAAGTPLDASLQPGTGSTDAIIGAYYHQSIGSNVEVFVNGQFQSALRHRMDAPGNDYRPGNSTTLSFGLRYEMRPRWIPQLQINLVHKAPDQGALADIQSTAGTVAYLSPGFTVQFASLHVFGFVQVPAYSNLYGYQLFPRYTASVGASYGF
ncbi:MAG: hypothetical protein PVSMB6_18900 [Steroidobacteraceae bacterium]